jgi:hypothetical protein
LKAGNIVVVSFDQAVSTTNGWKYTGKEGQKKARKSSGSK